MLRRGTNFRSSLEVRLPSSSRKRHRDVSIRASTLARAICMGLGTSISGCFAGCSVANESGRVSSVRCCHGKTSNIVTVAASGLCRIGRHVRGKCLCLDFIGLRSVCSGIVVVSTNRNNHVANTIQGKVRRGDVGLSVILTLGRRLSDCSNSGELKVFCAEAASAGPALRRETTLTGGTSTSLFVDIRYGSCRGNGFATISNARILCDRSSGERLKDGRLTRVYVSGIATTAKGETFKLLPTSSVCVVEADRTPITLIRINFVAGERRLSGLTGTSCRGRTTRNVCGTVVRTFSRNC